MLSLLLRAAAIAAVVAAVLRLGDGLPSRYEVATPPGAEVPPAGVQARLRRALAERPRSEPVRTRHRNVDGSPRFTNRLIVENSPYLLQHAHNPVDWYPWGDEAFARARRENKPILLSVGYSTCHWCHVMEEESFEDEEIADYLNRHYIAVKVDREARPDVDGVYMTAVQHMTGKGGWPLTLWLTPERQPFYGGTYFPPRDGDRGIQVGFLSILTRLQAVYREQPARVSEASADLVQQLQRAPATPADALPGTTGLLLAYRNLRATFDKTHGGFGRAPKFPRSVALESLLRYHRRTGEAEALAMVEQTLTAIATGGIRDHVGGGFHRYATDAAWRVPHFEKMLYDNALLVVAYLEAFQVTRRADFARVVRETLAYVEREMTAPEGGFYAAQDADSEGEEGTFFLWTPATIRAALGPRRPPPDALLGKEGEPEVDERALRLAIAYYGVTDAGNFEGQNVLYVARPLADVATETGLDAAEAESLLQQAVAQLYRARQRRVPPLTDRKIVPAWNGLMISAFARAAEVLRAPAYAEAAARAARFVIARLTRGDRLRRAFFDGEAGGDGYLDDYAFLVAGLLDLFEANHDPYWLERALALQRTLDARFSDQEGGGYFFTADDQETLLAREKPAYDGAEPSGNSVALLNLLRLDELTGDPGHRQRAERALRGFERTLTLRAATVPRMLAALDFSTDLPKEIVIVTPDAGAAAPLFDVLAQTFVPNRVLAVVDQSASNDELAAVVPLVAQKVAQNGRATAYVCERRVCALPTNDPAVFARQLATAQPIPGSDNVNAVMHAEGKMR